VEVIGDGGFGVVYRAEHPDWETVVYKELKTVIIRDRSKFVYCSYIVVCSISIFAGRSSLVLITCLTAVWALSRRFREQPEHDVNIVVIMRTKPRVGPRAVSKWISRQVSDKFIKRQHKNRPCLFTGRVS